MIDFKRKNNVQVKNSKKILKMEKGITLIALVITVIVMLILAGVAISVLTNDGGIFDKTRASARAYENSTEKEAEQINNLMNGIDQYLAGVPVSSKPKIDGSWNGKVNVPKLATGMTAVYWNENGQEVELTSLSSNNEWKKWYSYTAQTGATATAGSGTSKWANAVTKDENGNITGYWVWIPRYEYKLTAPASGAKAGTIDINFIPTETRTPSSSEYKIHPVFTNDINKGGWDSELPGFWIAKYPAGYQKNTVNESGNIVNGSDTVVYSNLKYTNPANPYTNALGQNMTTTNYSTIAMSYPVFKPLTYAYNCINVDSMYRLSQDIKNKSEFYGLLSTETDSHLTKNSEWGAVAYLAWSKYGRNGTEPNINNVNLNNKGSRYIYAVTGIVATGVDNADTNGTFYGNPFNTVIGELGSSTGNITGVYDMNGCIWEYTAGYINNTSGATNRNTYGAALTATNSSTKYKTIYSHNSSSDNGNNNWNANNVVERHGDAIKETSTSGSGNTSWNGDASSFPYSSLPYILRGGYFSSTASAGIFAFHYYDHGDADGRSGFRVCLTL